MDKEFFSRIKYAKENKQNSTSPKKKRKRREKDKERLIFAIKLGLH